MVRRFAQQHLTDRSPRPLAGEGEGEGDSPWITTHPVLPKREGKNLLLRKSIHCFPCLPFMSLPALNEVEGSKHRIVLTGL